MPQPKKRRARKRPVLDDYETYLTRAEGKEVCAVCGKAPGTRRLDRDHSHRSGDARGLLCHRCNRALPSWINSEWLELAAAYLRRYGE